MDPVQAIRALIGNVTHMLSHFHADALNAKRNRPGPRETTRKAVSGDQQLVISRGARRDDRP